MFRCYFSDLVSWVAVCLVVLVRLVVVSCGLLLFCVAVVCSLGGSACGFARLLFFCYCFTCLLPVLCFVLLCALICYLS